MSLDKVYLWIRVPIKKNICGSGLTLNGSRRLEIEMDKRECELYKCLIYIF